MLLFFFFLFHYHLLAIHYVETLGQCAIHCAAVDGVYAICGRLLHYRRNNLHDAGGIVVVAEDAYGHTDGGCLTVLGGDVDSVQNMIGHKSEGTSQNSKGHKSTTDEHRPFGKNVMTLQERIVDFCSEPKSMADIADFLGVKDKRKARERYVDPQLGITLERTIPDKPTSRLQKYIAIKKGTSHT